MFLTSVTLVFFREGEMWWHETIRRVFVVAVYVTGAACMVFPLIGTVTFLERLGPSQTNESLQQVFWVALLVVVGGATLAAHKLVNWVFQKGELNQRYNPGHLSVDGSLNIEGEVGTNSKVLIENVRVSAKKPSV